MGNAPRHSCTRGACNVRRRLRADAAGMRGWGGGDQEGEEVGAGAVLEDHEGEVLLGAPVAGGDGALLVVDAVHLPAGVA
jgi:hypothetical protein